MHELRVYQNVSNCGGSFSYWRTPSQAEVDFIWRRGKTAVGIEVKAAADWRDEYGKPLTMLFKENRIQKCFGIYTGKSVLWDGPVEVLPIVDFLRKLTAGGIIK